MATTEVSPTGTVAVGKTKVGVFAGALTAQGSISLATDIGHAGFLNVSFYIPGGLGDWNPAVEQNKFTDPRLGSPQDFEAFGTANWKIPDLKLIEDMQGTGTGTPKGLVVEGTAMTLVLRYGIAASTDWAITTQRAWSWPIVIGKRYVALNDTAEGGKYCLVCPIVVTGTATEDVVITT
jgi:hypothetical protein